IRAKARRTAAVAWRLWRYGADPAPRAIRPGLAAAALAGLVAPAARKPRHPVPARRHRLDGAAARRPPARLVHGLDGRGASVARRPGGGWRDAAGPLAAGGRARRGRRADL